MRSALAGPENTERFARLLVRCAFLIVETVILTVLTGAWAWLMAVLGLPGPAMWAGAAGLVGAWLLGRFGARLPVRGDGES